MNTATIIVSSSIQPILTSHDGYKNEIKQTSTCNTNS